MMQLIADQKTPSQPRATFSVKWSAPLRHEFLAAACQEEEGGFSVHAMQYPGVVSQGETIEEARANIAEAFLGMLEACKKRGQPLPYSHQSVVEMTSGCQKLWITVDG